MTKSKVVFTSIVDSAEAGEYIGKEILSAIKDPDVIIIFASSKHDYTKLLKAIKKQSLPKFMVGCSSAGEFTSDGLGEGSVSAVAIQSNDMKFSASIGKHISADPTKAAQDVVASFQGMNDTTFPHRSALIMADALAGYTDTLVDTLNQLTAGTYQFFGGGAGDDAKFSKTHVFFGTEVVTNAVVGLEILSHTPLGIGVRHGWEKAGKDMRVTEAVGMKLVSLNAMPAVDAFKAHAAATQQKFDISEPVPFFLHNVLGIKTRNGHKLRVPLSVNKDGSILCASDIPQGAVVNIMKTTAKSASLAAKEATEDALRQTNANESGVALVFDCVATRLRTGREFSSELDSIATQLGKTPFVGCNTYGQISRVDGQFNGFHNCTAVVCVIPA